MRGLRWALLLLAGLWLLLLAAWHRNPGEAKGLGGAQEELLEQPWGEPLVGAVALGLVAYGLYSVAAARYHRGRSKQPMAMEIPEV